MNKKLMFAAVAVLVLATTVCFSAAKKFTDLMQIPEFVKADPEARLVFVNAKIESKEFGSSDLNQDLIARLILDVLVKEKTPTAQIQKYGQLRVKCPKLSINYDLETHLVVQYLATDPEAVKADLMGKMKLIQKLQNEKIIDWPTVAPLHKGMLALYLCTTDEYMKKDPMAKIEFLSTLDGLKVVSSMTSSTFSKGVGQELMSNTPADKQADTYKKIDAMSDFFTKSGVRVGYID
jgi:hypothetical protein